MNEIKQGSKLTINELKSLCDFDNGIYTSKQGNEYIEALSKLFNITNKNDKPFTEDDVISQPTLNDFNFLGKNDFIFCCELKAKPMTIINDIRKNEMIKASNFANDKVKQFFETALGVSYMLTCPLDEVEYIVKIGQTRTPFKKRLQSYNCGCVFNWRTASTTNIKILQSMVTTRLVYKLYICDCSEDKTTIIWHGIESVPFASPKSLAVEDIMVKKFIEQFNKKPLANVQTNATND